MENKVYVIALKNDVVSEDTIFTTVAENKEEALKKYAEDYLVKNKGFKTMVEDRSVRGIYGHIFYKDIYNFSMSEGSTTSLTTDEISVKLKENIKEYLGEYQQYTDMLFNFYEDDSKNIKDLDHELLMILALKFLYEESEYYLIREVSI